MSGTERTDAGAREDTAGEGIFERTDGAIHGPLERTEGRAGVRGVALPRTLVLARVAAPRRAQPATHGVRPSGPLVTDDPGMLPARSILDLLRAEPCDFLPPPDDGVPVDRPRAAYAFDGAAPDGEEVTSEVRVSAFPRVDVSTYPEPPLSRVATQHPVLIHAPPAVPPSSACGAGGGRVLAWFHRAVRRWRAMWRRGRHSSP